MIYRSGLQVLDDDDFVVCTLTREDAFAEVQRIYELSVDEDGEWDVAQAVLEGLIVDPLLRESVSIQCGEDADMLRTERIEDARSRNNDRM